MHALASSQGRVLAANAQPVVAWHESLVQKLLSLQVMAVPAHAPPPHLSPAVHALPSSQGAVLAMFWHAPLLVLQLSEVHGLLSLQSLAAPGVHAADLHTSPTVHGLPSLHAVVLALYWQPTSGSQASSVHKLPSSHTTCDPGRHTPLVHLSPTEHTELSALHGALSFCAT